MTSTLPTSNRHQYLALYESEALHVERYDNDSYWDARYHGRRMTYIRAILYDLIRSGEARFLDAGCGTGEYLSMAHEFGAIPIGIDLARNYTARAKQRCTESDVMQASLDALPLKTGSVDTLLCTEVLEHLPDDVYTGSLDELFRVTRNAVLITTPNYGVLRTLGNALLRGRVAKLDASVGHVAIFPLRTLLRRLRRREWTVVGARTVHIMPPVVGESLRLPRWSEPLVTGLEKAMHALFPRQGNVSLILCRRIGGVSDGVGRPELEP
jgi:SAM-dependent methyltransferase